jgi:hypothetical protein
MLRSFLHIIQGENIEYIDLKTAGVGGINAGRLKYYNEYYLVC